jgi:hypothetical protein
MAKQLSIVDTPAIEPTATIQAATSHDAQRTAQSTTDGQTNELRPNTAKPLNKTQKAAKDFFSDTDTTAAAEKEQRSKEVLHALANEPNVIAAKQKAAAKPKKSEVPKENAFPYDVFPSVIQDIVKATNETLNFPIDYIGASVLYAVSVAIGNTHKVQVKNSWIDSAVLYIAIVGRAGINKSHPLSFALRPIAEHDKKTYKQYEMLKSEYDAIVSLSKSERDAQGHGEPIKPLWEKFIVSDFTPESLLDVHDFNKRGLGVYSDELAGWFKNFNRYSKGSETEFWLSIWSGKPLTIDRKTSKSIQISNPFISVCGTIQNSILKELAKDNRSENGFIDRILFVLPENVQKPYWNELELNSVFVDNWRNVLSNIMQISYSFDSEGQELNKILSFSKDAKDLIFAWQKINADQCNNIENEAISGVYSKLETYAIRLSLILEIMYWSCGESSKENISAKAMQGALKLVEYFKNTASKVNAIITNSEPLEQLPKEKRALYDSLPNTPFEKKAGEAIAEKQGMSDRTFRRMLSDATLFTKIKHGVYEKII